MRRKTGRRLKALLGWAVTVAAMVVVALKTLAPPSGDATQQEGTRTPPREKERVLEWEALENPQLVDWGGNDGDSFQILHARGTHTFRLYFVDTPEKTDRWAERVRHQARYFDISTSRAMRVGSEAATYTLGQLQTRPFEILTRWERVMESDRRYALIRFTETDDGGWLHAELVRRGLARIYTLPTDMPDGTRKRDELVRLRRLEAQAKKGKLGAWGE